MKAILFFIVLWNTTPVEVEQKEIKEFNSIYECRQTQELLTEEGRHGQLVITNDMGFKGRVIGTLCEEEEQTS